MRRLLLTDHLELANNQAKEFNVDTTEGVLNVFIVKHQDQLYAYQNKCPHLGIPLNWQPDEFMSIDSEHIQCSTHGALFNLNDGHCIMGPCSGQSLTSLPVEYSSDRKLWISLTY